MEITVLIPTYRRTADLHNCLKALREQRRPADQVLIVVRDSDQESWDFLQQWNHQILALQIAVVTVPGQVAALNAGLAAARGEIITITDDDAAPHADWLERIEAHFLSDEQIGGVGGRDILYINGELYRDEAQIVGQVSWFGRIVGNHHAGIGPARDVDILKGANMSYRRQAIQGLQFDARLRGTGAQVCNDLAFSLAVKRRGWKLLYDPAVCVDHYPAQRFDEDSRDCFTSTAHSNHIHNETLALLDYLPPWNQRVFWLWSNLIGTRANLGLLQLLRLWPQEGQHAIVKWHASRQGRLAAWQTWRQHT